MSLFRCKACNNECINCVNKCSIEKAEISSCKVTLVGNPNVGKSVVFKALSGFYVEISNYPGTTTDISSAMTPYGEIIDTPGAYSLGNYTDDETITQKIVKTADVVVNVISALSLERDLFFTQQLIDMDFPLIVVLNQLDEAKKQGIKIDFEQLEAELGVKVVPCVAIHKQGIAELIEAIKEKKAVISENRTPYVMEHYWSQAPRCSIFEKLIRIESEKSSNESEKDLIYSQRRELVNYIVAKVVERTDERESVSEIIAGLLLKPVFGLLAVVFMLYLLYELLGVFVAGNIVHYILDKFDLIYIPSVTSFVDKILPNNVLNEMLVGDFGVLTLSVKIVFCVLLPLIIGFYLFMSILEDSGYLPRVAVLTDNLLNKIGLNGLAVIPLILGLGCGTMGTITTRILGSKKERTIVTALLGIAVPCAAQQGIIIALLAAIGGLKIWLLYLAVIFGVLVLSGTVLNKTLDGKSTQLLIDLPPIRIPLIKNTIEKTFYKSWNFLSEAIPIFVFSSLFITVLSLIGVLSRLQQLLSPIVVTLLNLPPEFSNIFVMGLIRRDFASVGILGMAGIHGETGILSSAQIFVASIVVTLFVPCLAALLVIYKERGFKEASLIWISTFVISITVGTILTMILGVFNFV